MVKFELKRMIRSNVLQLSIILMVMISVLGIILHNIYYSSVGDSRYLLLSLYNSFTQFTYLVLAFVIVSVFCKDFQTGVYKWYEQLGVSFNKVTKAKFLSLLVTILPIVNIVLLTANIFSGNKDVNYFLTILGCANLNMIYIVAVAFFLSVVFRKTIVSTLVMYGVYILFNALNLWGFGLLNPTDANSISSYYLGKVLNPAQVHYSLNKLTITDSWLCFATIVVPIIWILVLMGSSYFVNSSKISSTYKLC